jgi:hypothetical protein
MHARASMKTYCVFSDKFLRAVFAYVQGRRVARKSGQARALPGRFARLEPSAFR